MTIATGRKPGTPPFSRSTAELLQVIPVAAVCGLLLAPLGLEHGFGLFGCAIACIVAVRFPEIPMVVMLGTSLFKSGLSSLAGLDVTLIALGGCALGVAAHVLKRRRAVQVPRAATALLLAWLGLMGLAMCYSKDLGPAAEKMGRLVVLDLSLMMLAYAYFSTGGSVRRAVVVFCVVAVAYSVAAVPIALFWGDAPWRVAARAEGHGDFTAAMFGATYLGPSRFMATAAIMLLCLPGSRSLPVRWLGWGAVLLVLLDLMLMGASGPIVALLLSMACLTVVFPDSMWRRVTSLGLAATLSAATLGLLALQIMPEILETTTIRAMVGTANYLARYSEGDISSDPSALARVGFVRTIVRHIDEFLPVGAGVGGFGWVHSGGGGGYPHNLLLEVFTDAGIPGLLAFIALAASIFWTGVGVVWRASTRREDRIALAVLGAASVNFVAAQFSFDIAGHRAMWFFWGVILALDARGATAPERRVDPVLANTTERDGSSASGGCKD